MLDIIPIEGYYGISFNETTQVFSQQFQQGQVISRFASSRQYDRRTFSISLPIKNKNEIDAFLRSKRGVVPFIFNYDNLTYTCAQYSFTYTATYDYLFEATFVRDDNVGITQTVPHTV